MKVKGTYMWHVYIHSLHYDIVDMDQHLTAITLGTKISPLPNALLSLPMHVHSHVMAIDQLLGVWSTMITSNFIPIILCKSLLLMVLKWY